MVVDKRTPPPWKILRRRNSVVEFYRSGGIEFVSKTYHAVYAASDEERLYRSLGNLIWDMPALNVAKLVGVDSSLNSIQTLYVQGRTLKASLALFGLSSARPFWFDQVLELVIRLSKHSIEIDADPSNLIISEQDQIVTIVDPVIDVNGYRHLSAVVFLVGLLKYRLRYIWRMSDMVRFYRLWSIFIFEYAQATEVSCSEVYGEISKYCVVVSGWNRNTAVSIPPSWVAWAFRRTILSFGWRVLSVVFLSKSKLLAGKKNIGS